MSTHRATLKGLSSTGHVYDSRGWGIKIVALAGKVCRWAKGAVSDAGLVFTGI